MVDTLQQQFNAISGVLYTNIVDVDGEQTLQVAWDGRPNDYTAQVSEIKTDVAGNVTQVRPTPEQKTKTPDGMPIHYYQVQ